MSGSLEITARIVNILERDIRPGRIIIRNGRIAAIEKSTDADCDTYLIPGFVDSHVHVESSMLVPSQFARAAVCHGTVGTVSDPHEIANVLGMQGVEFMLNDAQQVPFKFCFGAPACVPATTFETAGASLTVDDVRQLLDDDRIGYLSEVMDFPAVLRRDSAIMDKITAAHQRGKIVDGHAPGLRGEEARRYVSAGIKTDHECFSKAEALDKLAAGCHISIREGSAARNFAALHELINEFPDRVMLCSDDKHPDELVEGHIDRLVARAVALGSDVFHALRAACVNPVQLYNLPIGQLQVGDAADCVELADLESFRALRTYLDGQLVAENGRSLIEPSPPTAINRFAMRTCQPSDFGVPAATGKLNVIQAFDGELITKRLRIDPKTEEGCIAADVDRDLLKLTVVNRYGDARPAVAFAHGFGLKQGAMASSVAHDSHNVVAVGASDDAICQAVNLVAEHAGGLSVVSGQEARVLPLPVAGLMALATAEEVADEYRELDAQVKRLGSQLRAPFMTLSFMALLVIPEIKLSDRGLFDGVKFEFLPLVD